MMQSMFLRQFGLRSARKLVSIFVDADDEIRVKDDQLREVLSRIQNYAAGVAEEVLQVLRNEFGEEVTLLRNLAEQQQEELRYDFCSKKLFFELEELTKGLEKEVKQVEKQLRSEKRPETLSVGLTSALVSPSPSMVHAKTVDSRPREELVKMRRLEVEIQEICLQNHGEMMRNVWKRVGNQWRKRWKKDEKSESEAL